MNSPNRGIDSRIPNRSQKSSHSSKSSSPVWLELVHFCDVGRLTLQGETEISWHHLKEFQVSGDSTDIFNRAEVTLGCRSHNISVENKDMSISEKFLENLPAPNGTKDPKWITNTQ